MNLKRLMRVKDSENYELNWDAVLHITAGNADSDILLDVLDHGERAYGDRNRDVFSEYESRFDRYLDSAEKSLRVNEADSSSERRELENKAWIRANFKALQSMLPDADTFAKYYHNYLRAVRRIKPSDKAFLESFVKDVRKVSPYGEYDRGDNVFYLK